MSNKKASPFDVSQVTGKNAPSAGGKVPTIEETLGKNGIASGKPPGFRDDQIPDKLTPKQEAKLKKMNPAEKEKWYGEYLQKNGVNVQASGKTIRVLPEEYFRSYAELYRQVDRLETRQKELLGIMADVPKESALMEFSRRMERLAKLVEQYKQLSAADIQRMNRIGEKFLEMDESLAKGIGK